MEPVQIPPVPLQVLKLEVWEFHIRAWKERNDINYQALETKMKRVALPQTALAAHHGQPIQTLKQLEKHETQNTKENLTH